jgi:hypothetical protein
MTHISGEWIQEGTFATRQDEGIADEADPADVR